MKKVLILWPRLDCTFKPGPVNPKSNAPLPPIRQHWEQFLHTLYNYHDIVKRDNVIVHEAPLWTFVPELVNDHYKPNVVYVPHKQFHQFPVDGSIEPRYYMQTVFPWLFSVDNRGWGAQGSFYPFVVQKYPADYTYPNYQHLLARAAANESKFEQPAACEVPYDDQSYILFVCQIPHDEVIKFHSRVDVMHALEQTLIWARQQKKFVVVKGHPVNPASMIPLKQLQERYRDVSVWVDTEYSIHALLYKCRAAFMVNSGVGYEAILHNKPVFTFGDVEYNCVANFVRPASDATPDGAGRNGVTWLDIERAWVRQAPFTPETYRDFLESYCDTLYHETNTSKWDLK